MNKFKIGDIVTCDFYSTGKSVCRVVDLSENDSHETTYVLTRLDRLPHQDLDFTLDFHEDYLTNYKGMNRPKYL